MYYVEKRITISAAHNLHLSYESKCEALHGHNFVVTVYCKSEELNEDGMVTDFTHIKRIVKETFDHKYINEVLDVNPSSENIARWICDHELLQGQRPRIRRQYRHLRTLSILLYFSYNSLSFMRSAFSATCRASITP